MDTDTHMHRVLLELMLLQHGSTQSWNPTTSGGRDRDPRPPGDSNPVAEQYRDRYTDATHELAKQRVLHDARDELAQWRGHGVRRHAGETPEEQERRILDDGQGFDPHTVAVRFDTNAGRIRKLRVAHGYLPETGTPLPGTTPEYVRSPDRVRELHDQGYTLRQITTITKISKSTVHRILGKAA